ncbi:hypothetical protein [Mucilaginibacter agri]|uniref:SPOR domain-containing protein n=1 Tax=Mucilaginibacter agri TaxID=2695265 RepID=A0A966DQY3_9SPHI|nr:hypothetical protein [Mucilaginibacter agri]NCD67915.1 hypothetical protein [Mucilaginibacter agri]
MDLSNYVSELIKQRGKLSVPGLGQFVHLRKSSYYDKESGTLYPPYYETTFDGSKTDPEDTSLLAYIAEKRNISHASARFFLDKYVDTIRERAEVAEFDFADLGSFYIDEFGKIAFKTTEAENTFSSTVFGYPPISIRKLIDLDQPVNPKEVTPTVDAPTEQEKEPVIDEAPIDFINSKPVAPVEIIPEPIQEANIPPVSPVFEPQENIEEEYPEAKSNLKYWIIAAVVLILGAAGIFYYYKYYQPHMAKGGLTTARRDSAPSNVVKIDSDTTAQKDSIPPLGTEPPATKDSVSKVPVQPTVDAQGKPVTNAGPMAEIPKNTWLILGGSFNNYNNAVANLAKYRALGYPQARLLDSVQRKEYFAYKIIFGYRYTKKDADAARIEILKPRKLKPKFISVEPYK